ncbi:MAG: hypothetical protein CUN51_01455 [Candidatus Thermofonsia Clade 1 bacterium]|uniref:Alginate lyase 2 domain-containing protein n=1 Tax=Candidatus Thermofonsia Clade 1 bacterium TaxID=2364210 RepID=A0A2M8P450_9CHLR|nr:MAG: hypothetical protein CUN51_01455 [Candidatus Thermofonsia Clade 1 bacterium]
MLKKALYLTLIVTFAAVALGSGALSVHAQGNSERIKLKITPGMRPLDLIRQLRNENLIPGGGSQQLTVPHTVINVRNQGFWYFPIGRGTQLRDFVLHFEMRAAELPSPTNGCGMAFRIVSDDDFSYVMLTADRRIILVQRDRGENIVEFDQVIDELEGIDAADYELDRTQLHFITVIAYGNELTLFLNGIEITRETTARSVRGRFATMLFNEEGNPSNTECRYSNVFAWNLQ